MKQIEAIRQIQRLISQGAVPLCEKFIKPVICEVFLNQQMYNRSVKIQCYKLIQQLTSFFDIVSILRMDDEPTIEQDLLDSLISDSQSQVDSEMVLYAYRLVNTNLLSFQCKVEFIKANE